MPIKKSLLYEIVGKNLKERRLKLGITQEYVANSLRIGRTSVTNIEAGTQNFPIHLLYEFCILLDCEIKEIIPSISELKNRRNLVVHGDISRDLSDVLDSILEQNRDNHE